MKKTIWISLLSLAAIVVAGQWLLFIYVISLHLDFSQEHHKVEAVDKIRFQDNWSGKIYRRAFWGLCPVGIRENGTQDNDLTLELSEDGDCQAVRTAGDGGLWYGYDSQEGHIFLGHLVGEVEEIYDTQYSVSQITLSSDERYILFCEIEYDVNGGYSSDEEYCYYRVIDRKNGEQYTIYSGYREWFQVYWDWAD